MHHSKYSLCSCPLQSSCCARMCLHRKHVCLFTQNSHKMHFSHKLRSLGTQQVYMFVVLCGGIHFSLNSALFRVLGDIKHFQTDIGTIIVLGLCSCMNIYCLVNHKRKWSAYPMPSLYFWISFCLSSLSSTQYSLGMTKLDVIRHSGQDLQRKKKIHGGKSPKTLWNTTFKRVPISSLNENIARNNYGWKMYGLN